MQVRIDQLICVFIAVAEEVDEEEDKKLLGYAVTVGEVTDG